MKPPSSLVLLPAANKNKVLTYCKSYYVTHWQLTWSSLLNAAIISNNMCAIIIMYNVCDMDTGCVRLFLENCNYKLCMELVYCCYLQSALGMELLGWTLNGVQNICSHLLI